MGLIVLEAYLLDTEITKEFNKEENFDKLKMTIDSIRIKNIKKILNRILSKKHSEYRPYFAEIML